MNIWIYVSGEPLPTDGNDTRLRRMGNFSLYASELGHNVEWFCSSFEHYTKKQRCEKSEVIQYNDNLKINLIKTIGYRRNISISRILSQKVEFRQTLLHMRKKNYNPDIIITPIAALTISDELSNYCKKNSIPLVADVRDLWPEIYFDVIDERYHKILGIYVKHIQARLVKSMKNVTSVIGLSPDFLKYGLKYANRKRNNFDAVIPIGYPDYNYEYYRKNFLKNWSKYGISRTDFIIVFLGNFGNQFDFTPIIEASKHCYDKKDIKFVLCGIGKQLENIKSECMDNVIFPGWIEKEEIASLLCYSKLGLMPYIQSKNYKLNTPNKFGEYLSASLPILTSVEGVMENYANKYECGFRYEDGSDLLDRIEFYYNNKEIRNVHSNNARKLYEKQFDISISNEKILNCFTNIIKTKRGY